MGKSENWVCCNKMNGETKEVKCDMGKHYAKSVCAHCDHFVCWLKDPKITKRIMERDEKINTILKEHTEELDDKKISFLKGIQGVRFPTLRQLSYLDNLFNKFQ